jgi:hypothetical protein
MKHSIDRRPLLDAVLDETVPGGYREAVLHNTLRAVHRRKRVRAAGRVLLTVVGLAVLALVLEPWLAPKRESARQRSSSLTILSSQPLNPSLIAKTRTGMVATVHSSPGSVLVVNTIPMPDRLNLLDDDQLLALLADYGAVLVRDHPTDPPRLFLTAAAGHRALAE